RQPEEVSHSVGVTDNAVIFIHLPNKSIPEDFSVEVPICGSVKVADPEETNLYRGSAFARTRRIFRYTHLASHFFLLGTKTYSRKKIYLLGGRSEEHTSELQSRENLV